LRFSDDIAYVVFERDHILLLKFYFLNVNRLWLSNNAQITNLI
jgi:hypothetical protein